MANRLHPYRRQDSAAFEEECDAAALIEIVHDLKRQKEDEIEWATSPAQREFEGHDPDCEGEFISETGMWSPCQCEERANAQ